MRLTFLSHFILCLACLGSAFFAWSAGAPQFIFANDLSMMTSAIAALFVVTMAWLGMQAWLADEPPTYIGLDARGIRIDARPDVDASFGHVAERLAVMMGFVGTAIGLSLQAKSLAGGSTSFTALATSLFTTASGGVAAALITVMTYSLEQGIRRSRR